MAIEDEELNVRVRLIDDVTPEAQRMRARLEREFSGAANAIRPGAGLDPRFANLGGFNQGQMQASFQQALRNQQTFVTNFENQLVRRMDETTRVLREGTNRQLRGADWWRAELRRHQEAWERETDEHLRTVLERRMENARRALRVVGTSPPMNLRRDFRLGGGGGGGPNDPDDPNRPPRPPHGGPWGPWGGNPVGPTGPRIPLVDPTDPNGSRGVGTLERLTRAYVQLRAFGLSPTGAGIGTLVQGFGNLTRAAGPLGMAIGAVGVAAFGASISLKKFADEYKELGQMQKQTGFDIGFIKSFTRQATEQGFDENEARSALSRFGAAYARFQLNPENFTHEIMKGVQPDQQAGVLAYLNRMYGARSSEEAAQILFDAANEVERATFEKLTREGNPAAAQRAAEARKKVLGNFDAEGLAGFKNLRLASPEERAMYEKLNEEAAKLNSTIASIKNNQKEINELLGAQVNRYTQPLLNLWNSILAAQLDYMKKEEARNQRQQKADDERRRQYDAGEISGWEYYMGKSTRIPSATQEERAKRRDPAEAERRRQQYESGEMSWYEYYLGTGQKRPPKPAAGGATRLFGGGPLDDLAGAAGIGGGARAGDAWDRLPMSENIEDRRNETVRLLTDETSDNTKATEELTGQMRTLNDFYLRLFAGDAGIGGGSIRTGSGRGGTLFRPGIRSPGSGGGGSGDVPSGIDPISGRPTFGGRGGGGGGGDVPANLPGGKARGAQAERIGEAKAAMMDQLRKEGVPEGNVEEAANLMLGQAIQESGVNPRAVHDQGTGYGIYGARLERRSAMLSWMKANGYAPDSLEGQSRFMIHEAMTNKRFARTRQALMTAEPGTRYQRTSIITSNFEAPADQGPGQMRNREFATGTASKVRAKGAAPSTPPPVAPDVSSQVPQPPAPSTAFNPENMPTSGNVGQADAFGGEPRRSGTVSVRPTPRRTRAIPLGRGNDPRFNPENLPALPDEEEWRKSLPDQRSALDGAQMAMSHTVRGEGFINVKVSGPPGTQATGGVKGKLFTSIPIDRDIVMPPSGTGSTAEV